MCNGDLRSEHLTNKSKDRRTCGTDSDYDDEGMNDARSLRHISTVVGKA
jgi:hypothetical protein